MLLEEFNQCHALSCSLMRISYLHCHGHLFLITVCPKAFYSNRNNMFHFYPFTVMFNVMECPRNRLVPVATYIVSRLHFLLTLTCYRETTKPATLKIPITRKRKVTALPLTVTEH